MDDSGDSYYARGRASLPRCGVLVVHWLGERLCGTAVIN